MFNENVIIGFNQTNNTMAYNPTIFTFVFMTKDININWK